MCVHIITNHEERDGFCHIVARKLRPSALGKNDTLKKIVVLKSYQTFS